MAEAQQQNTAGNVHGGKSEEKHEKAKSYEDYLQLEKVLGGVRRLSKENGDPQHDEHLFIIIHQAFEIWFKQMLFDMDSIIEIFDERPGREEKKMLTIINRLQRMVLIWKLLIDQLYIIETMPPLNFLEFRCHLGSASGFQSLQFRLIENKYGLKEKDRKLYGAANYIELMHSEESKEELRRSTEAKTLFGVVEKWLEGIADIDTGFWDRYTKAAKDTCEAVTDTARYDADQQKGLRRLSHKGLQGALTIALKRDEDGYCLPYQVMTLLTDVDALIMKWRYNHVLMVHRMIGSKQGTGGSSGYGYLKSTVSDEYRVFIDLFNLSAFLIPRKDLEDTAV